MTTREVMEALIARSSFGTKSVVRLRAMTPHEVTMSIEKRSRDPFDGEGFVASVAYIAMHDEGSRHTRTGAAETSTWNTCLRKENDMAKDAPGMRGNRSRNQNGQLRDTRDDKFVGTLEEQYGRDFDVRSDMHVGTLLDRSGVDSVAELLRSDAGRKGKGGKR